MGVVKTHFEACRSIVNGETILAPRISVKPRYLDEGYSYIW